MTSTTSRQTNLAIVNEWFYTIGGAERVLEEVLRLHPGADLYALVDFMPADQRWLFGDSHVFTSFLQRMPFAKKYFRHYLPLMPMAVEQFDLSPYDAVVSLSHAVAKGAITRADQLHLCYIHTPIRYAWDLQHDYLRESQLDRGLKGMFVRMVLHYLRLFDRLSADRVDVFVANSRYVAERVRKTYRRSAQVIYPPVDVNRFTLRDTKDDYYITASRLVPYKRIDRIVEAFRTMPDKRLRVFGEGPELKRLQALATPNVELLGHTTTGELQEALQHARAFVFAADEDFGIAPVEAQACGTPVIAYGRGGALESVVANRTGIFFAEQTASSIAEAVTWFDRNHERFDPWEARQNAERFSCERFRREFSTLLESEVSRLREGEIPRWQDDRDSNFDSDSELQAMLAAKRHRPRSTSTLSGS
jgi:glycosyltransferase involved in cell wall biosynthesis